jgi:hypothetical protein
MHLLERVAPGDVWYEAGETIHVGPSPAVGWNRNHQGVIRQTIPSHHLGNTLAECRGQRAFERPPSLLSLLVVDERTNGRPFAPVRCHNGGQMQLPPECSGRATPARERAAVDGHPHVVS